MQGRRFVNPRVKWLFGGLGTTVVGVLLVFALDKAFDDNRGSDAKPVKSEVKKTAAKKPEEPKSETPKVEPERGPIDERQLVKIFRDYKDTVAVLKPDFEKLVVGRTLHIKGRVRWNDFAEGKDKVWVMLDLDGTDLDVKCSVRPRFKTSQTPKKGRSSSRTGRWFR